MFNQIVFHEAGRWMITCFSFVDVWSLEMVFVDGDCSYRPYESMTSLNLSRVYVRLRSSDFGIYFGIIFFSRNCLPNPFVILLQFFFFFINGKLVKFMLINLNKNLCGTRNSVIMACKYDILYLKFVVWNLC